MNRAPKRRADGSPLGDSTAEDSAVQPPPKMANLSGPSNTANLGQSSSIDHSRLIIDAERESSFAEKRPDVKEHVSIQIGAIFNEYTIMKLLGRGHFSAVYLTQKAATNQYNAVKIPKPGEQFKKACEEEIKFLNAIQKAGGHQNIVQFFDSCKWIINGIDHFCIISEAMGPNLESIFYFSNQKIIPLKNVRKMATQLLNALSFLHDDVGIIHADVKPENIMIVVGKEDIEATANKDTKSFAVDLCNPDSACNIKLGDFGNCINSDRRPSLKYIQTCQYRALESFISSEYDSKIDIWSFACVVYKLLTRCVLSPCRNDLDDCGTHLNRISEKLGRISNQLFHGSLKPNCAHYFGPDGIFKASKTVKQTSTLKQDIRRMLPEPDATEFYDFLRCCLHFNPRKRLSAKEALQHPFINMAPLYPKADEEDHESGEKDKDNTESKKETTCEDTTTGSSTAGTSATST
uniref:Protein kinase domain-containing protein n=1 Tax=Caenorhabditis tropicalis TaxID=1561998 RepID=A0A1I7TLA6_9PELO